MKLLLFSVLLVLTGYGAVDRTIAGFAGVGSEVCQDGVVYLQFTSGTSVKYETTGRIATCK